MNIIKKTVLGVAVGATALATATPAMADDYRYRRHHDNTGAAVAAGIAGLAIGAIIASGDRYDRYDRYDRRYYNGYYNQGYYPNYTYYYPNYAYTNGGWYNGYRYNDGYIYRVDPTTQLVTAVINALV